MSHSYGSLHPIRPVQEVTLNSHGEYVRRRITHYHLKPGTSIAIDGKQQQGEGSARRRELSDDSGL